MKDKRNASLKADFDVVWLTDNIKAGSPVALARGITLIESNNPDHRKKASILIENCLNSSQKSLRIGITGVPGVGKSTFIEALGNLFTADGKKVAILAIDPSSTISKGSILGDKTRMPSLATNPNAFIRPSAAGDSLGGVARKTREAIILCECAGFDTVIVETVGVGQSETVVHSMVDFFLLLKISGAGDELQGIKRGIMEMADAIVITKDDGDNQVRAKSAKQEFQRALHLYPPKTNGWEPKVLTASAYENKGISEVKELIGSYEDHCRKTGNFSLKRAEQNTEWMEQTLLALLQDRFKNHPKIKDLLPYYREQVALNKQSPFKAAEELLNAYNKGNN